MPSPYSGAAPRTIAFPLRSESALSTPAYSEPPSIPGRIDLRCALKGDFPANTPSVIRGRIFFRSGVCRNLQESSGILACCKYEKRSQRARVNPLTTVYQG